MREQRSASALPIQDVSPSERILRARLAAHSLHAKRDPRQTTANGRKAFLDRFEREVDPDGALDQTERRRRAAQARRAYFTRLALAAVQARRTKRAERLGGDAA
jgi:hypothetical protein